MSVFFVQEGYLPAGCGSPIITKILVFYVEPI